MIKFYSKVILILVLACGSYIANAQTTYYSGANGIEATNVNNWWTNTNGTGSNPGDFITGDIFVVQSGHSITVSASNWTIDNGGTLQIDASGTVTVTGTRNVFLLNFSSLDISGSYVHNSTAAIQGSVVSSGNTVNTGSTFTIGTNQTLNAINMAFGNLVLSSSVTVSTNKKITLDGSLILNTGSTLNMTNTGTTGNLINGGSFTSQTGSGTFDTKSTNAAPVPNSVTWAGTVRYSGSSAQTISYGTYTNLNGTGGNRTFSTGGTIAITGTFTTGSGTYTTTSSTVNFSATGSQTIPALTSSSYNNVTVSNTGTKTLGATMTFTGTLSLPNSADFLSLNGNTLTLQGATSLTGALKGSSSSSLTISGTSGGAASVKLNGAANDSLLNTLTINRTGAGNTITVNSNLGITNKLDVANGTLDLNARVITLKSTSITNTARVAAVTGTITHSGGYFVIERYIPTSPTNHRAYRDLCTGGITPANTLFNTWQEAGNTPSGFGTHITGLVGVSPGGVDATTGLDITGSGNKSMFYQTTGTFFSVDNTKTTTLDPARGYRILIRGDRNVNLYQTPQPTTMNTATVLRATGTLITGTVNYSTSGVSGGITSGYSLSNTLNEHTFLANPYANAIDWNALTRSNLLGTYWVFDPTVGTAGGYVIWDGSTNNNGSSNVNQYIQPGQSFFVQTIGASPTMSIQESNKATGSTLTGVFRNNLVVNKLAVTLKKQIGANNIVMDGAVAVINSADDNGVDFMDAEKFANSTENLAIYRASKKISIEHRNSTDLVDTLPLRIWTVANGINYTLSFDAIDFVSTQDAYLLDKYAHTYKLIKASDTTNYSFTVATTDTTSYINRFAIVFGFPGTLPISSINIQATAKNNGVQIAWNTTNETAMLNYEVEKSTNGNNFNYLATVKANNQLSNSYTLFDANANKGLNYYRIKMIGTNGDIKYSKIIAINLDNSNTETVTVYPNPIKNAQVTIQLKNLQKDIYSITLYNNLGQAVVVKNVLYDGNTTTQTLNIDKNLASGNYTLVVKANHNDTRISKTVVIEN